MAQTKGKINTLTIPVWFIVLVCWLLSFRVYAKLTQNAAPLGKGVAWVTPTQLDEMAKKPGGVNKELILYEFTADWCPPCKKRERTVFRAPAVISEINNNFVPVRVDLTNDELRAIPATKNLMQLYGVNSIPRCIITLNSGEKVDDDRYLFGERFANFITKSRNTANTVRAKVALAKGHNAQALTLLTSNLVKGNVIIDRDSCAEYLMCHHLLLVTKHQAEVEPMMEKVLAKTSDYQRQTSEKDGLGWLRELNKYLRDEINDEQLLKTVMFEGDRSIYYLAIGLKQLRLGDKDKALKALHQAAVLSAQNYDSDGLSEPLVRELEK